MEVVCINENGWHDFHGNWYGFLEPRESEVGDEYNMGYGTHHMVQRMFLDEHGDLMYVIRGEGWEAEQFSIIQNTQEEIEAFIKNMDWEEIHKTNKEIIKKILHGI